MPYDTDQIVAYVQNKLNESERTQFELSLLTDKTLQASVKSELALRRSFKAIEETPETLTKLVRDNVALGLPKVLYVETMRSHDAPVRLASGEQRLLAIDVGPSPVDSYSISLRLGDDMIQSETAADDEGYVNFMLPPLPGGEHYLEIIADNQQRTIKLTATP